MVLNKVDFCIYKNIHIYYLQENNIKWIKDLKINPDALNLFKEKVGDSLKDIEIREDFLNRRPSI